MPHLRRLIIVNHLNKIEPLFFGQFELITRITLYDNELKTLEANTFTRLERLEELDLRNNAIEHMESLSVSFCKIDTVDLSHNSLRILINDIFKGSVVRKLVITHNKLLDIQHNAMPFHLKVLNLNYNEFQTFSLSKLKRTESVTDVKLSHNKLYTVEVFHISNKIEALDVSFNNLYTFPITPSMLRNRHNIKFISLAYNRLRSFDVDVFKGSGIDFTVMGNPWNCKCANKLIKVFNNSTSMIRQSLCDKKFLQSGAAPYCIMGTMWYNEDCPKVEIFPEEYFHHFQSALPKSDDCYSWPP
ncbi:carboxypeptidase N subunit 2-like [Zophobas morio]|uniref:carboxypeptidase N subunit 2-like n=1 Tax=Zophobas morio TaxID=2755281 RepID=UPI003083241A